MFLKFISNFNKFYKYDDLMNTNHFIINFFIIFVVKCAIYHSLYVKLFLGCYIFQYYLLKFQIVYINSMINRKYHKLYSN